MNVRLTPFPDSKVDLNVVKLEGLKMIILWMKLDKDKEWRERPLKSGVKVSRGDKRRRP